MKEYQSFHNNKTDMEEIGADKILCPKTVGWVLFAVTIILFWCGALLWCVLSTLSYMMQ